MRSGDVRSRNATYSVSGPRARQPSPMLQHRGKARAPGSNRDPSIGSADSNARTLPLGGPIVRLDRVTPGLANDRLPPPRYVRQAPRSAPLASESRMTDCDWPLHALALGRSLGDNARKMW